MARIPKRYSHFVFGVLQSGLTCAVAAAIAVLRMRGASAMDWLASWLIAWATMMPIVLVAAPWLRRLTDFLTGAPEQGAALSALSSGNRR